MSGNFDESCRKCARFRLAVKPPEYVTGLWCGRCVRNHKSIFPKEEQSDNFIQAAVRRQSDDV